MKKIIYTFLLLLVMFSCNNDDGIIIPQGSEEIDLTINFIGLNLQSSDVSAKSTKNSTSQKISDWVHIFQADLSIKFTNKETLKVFSLAYNPANPAAGYKIILPFGVYDYKLESLGDAYANYIPFKAEGIIEINKLTATLDLVGVTQYGLVTVDKFHITSAVLQDTQLGVIQMPSTQEHFYKYVLSQKAPLVKITEDLLNTQPSYQLPSISSLVRYNLMLGINELSVISFILSDFQQEDISVEIDQNAARTYVPDDNFEQKLIDLGYDDVLDDYVLTNNINTVTLLELALINNLTGIEDFTSLTDLTLGDNQLISINLSDNVALLKLFLGGSQLENINLTANLVLTSLIFRDGNLSSLDLSKNTALINFTYDGTSLLNCIQVNQTQLNNIPDTWIVNPGVSYSLDCVNFNPTNILGIWNLQQSLLDGIAVTSQNIVEFTSDNRVKFTYLGFGNNGEDIIEYGNWGLTGNELAIVWDPDTTNPGGPPPGI